MSSSDSSESAEARTGWFTRERYGNQAVVGGFIVAFGLLLCFAGYLILESADLMSNGCIGDNGQLLNCPAKGPDWARPLPAAAALLGLLAGFTGLLVGRPVRTPAFQAAALLTLAAMVGRWLMST